jgi:large subunit ribosomal protein L25
MSHVATIPAQKKSAAGTGAARAARREGVLPGVVYGGAGESVMVTVDPRDVLKGLNKPGFFATIFDLDMGKEKERVIPKTVQFHPVTDAPLHIDFLRVTNTTQVTVMVPVHLLNQDKCRGIKMGGVLNVARQAVQVSCPANSIPDLFEVDIANLKIGDAVKSSDIGLPEGVRFTSRDGVFTIATIAKPRGGAGVGEEEGEGGE